MITQGSITITLQLLPPEIFAITITSKVCNHYNYRLQQPWCTCTWTCTL